MTKKFAKIKKETNKQTKKKKIYTDSRYKNSNEAATLLPAAKKFPLKFPERGIIKPLSVSFLPLTDYNRSSRKKLKRSCLLLEQCRFGMLPKQSREARSFYVVSSIFCLPRPALFLSGYLRV